MSHFISFLHKLIFMPYPNPPPPANLADGQDNEPFTCSLSNVMPQLDIVGESMYRRRDASDGLT